MFTAFWVFTSIVLVQVRKFTRLCNFKLLVFNNRFRFASLVEFFSSLTLIKTHVLQYHVSYLQVGNKLLSIIIQREMGSFAFVAGKPFVLNTQPDDKQNIGDQCFTQPIKCDHNRKYRYLDGRCNNLKHLSWGMTNHTIVRLLPPVYSTNSSIHL